MTDDKEEIPKQSENTHCTTNPIVTLKKKTIKAIPEVNVNGKFLAPK